MSSLKTRLAVAFIGIPLIFFITIYGKLLFLAFVLIISVLATYEYYNLVKRKNTAPIFLIGALSTLLIDLTFYIGNLQYLLVILITTVLLTGLVELFRKPQFPNWSAISNFATTLFPIFYISLSLATLIGLREMKNLDYFKSGVFVLSIFAIIWICDTAAYFIGGSLGKRKLYERVSPKKTVEGFLGGLVFAFLSSFITKYFIVDFLTEIDAIVIAIIIGVLGQLGDLVESLIKRDVGVKDSSNIIPGHGGIFDRFDSLIYVAPFVYIYFVIFK
ncbi:MAG: phosphatidate cytidylyltransferase [Candidatus Kryptonium sp.]|nr:phosphatidate cytidylyltransferase [Candidatus Kryptonium sp.]MCX7762364.1 phosphatidate cytidylyltransferase [Candidatus Kryptonium sp.]MDW8109714.1 phosphatidate cytidylyltransferase [Candidatus Kryptonium sp.]